MRQTRWKSHVSEPKSKASRSWVAIVPRLATILRIQSRASVPTVANGHRASTEYPPNAVFPVSLADLRIAASLKERGIIWRGWHAARRGLASNLFELGVDDLTVSRILRHSGVQVTREHYIRRRDERMEAAFAKLETAMERGASKERKICEKAFSPVFTLLRRDV